MAKSEQLEAEQLCKATEARKIINKEIWEMKEWREPEKRRKAEVEKNTKAGFRMQLTTPDLSDSAKAWALNAAELAQRRVEGFKLRVGSSKLTLKKTSRNITQEVWEAEKRRQEGG
jgi:hypothetical protein